MFIFLVLTVALINPPESKEAFTHLELAKHFCTKSNWLMENFPS